jgi:Protein of unknown function (DUF2752)
MPGAANEIAAAPPPSLPDRLSSNDPPWSRKTPTGRVLRLLGVGAVIGAAVIFKIPLCPFAVLTRHPCPGCGLTRATLALLSGHWADAVHLHPLAPILSPLVGLMLAYNSLSYVRTGRFTLAEGLRGRLFTAAVTVLGAAMIGVWMARFLGAFGGPAPV